MRLKGIFVFRLLCLLVLSFVAHPLPAQKGYLDPSIMKDPTGYKLRSGDQIRIMVNGEPDATVDALWAITAECARLSR